MTICGVLSRKMLPREAAVARDHRHQSRSVCADTVFCADGSREQDGMVKQEQNKGPGCRRPDESMPNYQTKEDAESVYGIVLQQRRCRRQRRARGSKGKRI